MIPPREQIGEALSQFTPPLLIIFYSIVVPLISAFTERSDGVCFQRIPMIAHTILFCWVVVVAIVYCGVAEFGLYLTPTALQVQGRTLMLRMFPGKLNYAIVFGGILQLLVVLYWALFLGSEPLACWAATKKEDLARFEVIRVTVLIVIGTLLFSTVFLVNKYSKSNNTSPEEAAPILKT